MFFARLDGHLADFYVVLTEAKREEEDRDMA